MNEWLEQSTQALADQSGVALPELSDDDARALLDIARIASHTSGERTNAPLLCYLIGRIVEGTPDVSISHLKQILIERSEDAGGNV